MVVQDECVLAVGSGPMLLSLVEAWYESGLSRLALFVTDAQPTDPDELKRLWEQTLLRSPEASLDILAPAEGGKLDWEAIVRPFPFVLYASQHGGLEELRKLQQACKAGKKPMLPAIVLRGRGWAGPLLQSDGDGQWESAWRRVHSTVFSDEDTPQAFTAAAFAMLSNLVVHEWQKAAAGEEEPDCRNQVFILNPATLCGSWHSFLPHPLLSGYEQARPVRDVRSVLEADQELVETDEWFAYFERLTSAESGIFHIWEEGDLPQLPLSQCLVQPADPLSAGPAPLLPAIVRSALTHEEARRESGLAGLEAYAARLLPLLVDGLPACAPEHMGIGAGTFAEGVARGLRACLAKKWGGCAIPNEWVATRMEYAQIEDIRCRFYLQALTVMKGETLLAVGGTMLGFPVVWVCSAGLWYGSVDICLTLALRQSLQKALNQAECAGISSVVWKELPQKDIMIASCDPPMHAALVLSAIRTLKQTGWRLEVFDLQSEAFLREGPFGVYGVLLAEEESP